MKALNSEYLKLVEQERQSLEERQAGARFSDIFHPKEKFERSYFRKFLFFFRKVSLYRVVKM